MESLFLMSNYVAGFALSHCAKNKEPERLKMEMKINGKEWLLLWDFPE